MGTIITWIIIFAILCGCLFAWSYMLHRGPHADDDSGLPSCDGDCFHCAKNNSHEIATPDDCNQGAASR